MFWAVALFYHILPTVFIAGFPCGVMFAKIGTADFLKGGWFAHE